MRWCYCTDDTWLINNPSLRNLGYFAFAGRLSRALEGKSCMYSTNTGSFSSIFYNQKISSLAACIGKREWVAQCSQDFPKRWRHHLCSYERAFAFVPTDQVCLWHSGKPAFRGISLRWLDMWQVCVISVVFFPVPGCVAVIPKTGYCKSRSGHVVSV